MTEPGPWATRATWLLLPLLAGPLLTDALAPRSTAVRVVAGVLMWTAWTVALAASLVPRTVSLTVVRVVVPASVPAVLWAAAVAPDDSGVAIALAVVGAVLATAAAFSPLTGDAFVNGSAYGPERRMALRIPAALVVVAPLAWAALVSAVTAAPLLLAAHLWVPGAAALLVGVPVAYASARSLHGLSRRWVVFVPAGFVLHDPFTLQENLLFPRRMVSHLGPAPAGTGGDDVLDVSSGASGLALLLQVSEPLPVSVRRGRRSMTNVDTAKLLFTPTRPGAVLAEAAVRRLPT